MSDLFHCIFDCEISSKMFQDICDVIVAIFFMMIHFNPPMPLDAYIHH